LVIGGLVAFAGTLIIGVATSTGHADVAGVLLVLLAAVVYAIAVVAQKVVLRRIPGLQVTWLACLIGTASCLPFLPWLLTDVRNASVGATAGMIYLGVVPTATAFLTWAYALARSAAGRLGATTYVVPPIAIVLGWAFLDEVPVPLAVVGGVISLVGVGIARRKPKPALIVAPAAEVNAGAETASS
ncbi:MAG: DMT family transporter, partial [Nakamurella sp.]